MLKKLLNLFKKQGQASAKLPSKSRPKKPKVEAARIGEIGEHKINIQLDQLPKDCRYVSDLFIPNPKSRTGYSQIDHVVISPYGLFVIETKNYNGEIKGGRTDKFWTVGSRFKLYNPLFQNYGHIAALKHLLLPFESVKFVSMISFTMRCRFSIDPELRKIQSDELIVYDVELSEYIVRKLNRLKAECEEPPLSADNIRQIFELMTSAHIADPAIRSKHIQRIRSK